MTPRQSVVLVSPSAAPAPALLRDVAAPVQGEMFRSLDRWLRVTKFDRRAVALADRHYSRQTPGSTQLLPPGRTLLLVTPDARAVWGVVENLDPAGGLRWRCTIFRNEGPYLSSDLVREATTRTCEWWRRHYHRLPSVPLTTEVNPKRTRHKRDPGRCFRRAGWVVVGESRGLVVLKAPDPRSGPSLDFGSMR